MHPDDIRTKAGQELFNRINMIYGSHVWGEVLRGIIEIEKEMENDISQTFIGQC